MREDISTHRFPEKIEKKRRSLERNIEIINRSNRLRLKNGNSNHNGKDKSNLIDLYRELCKKEEARLRAAKEEFHYMKKEVNAIVSELKLYLQDMQNGVSEIEKGTKKAKTILRSLTKCR